MIKTRGRARAAVLSAGTAIVALTVGMAAAIADGSWTGPYIGMGIGARLNGIDWTTTGVTTDGTFATPFPDSSPKRNFDVTGIQFNGFAGYNLQMNGIVVGIEGGISGSGDSNSRTRQVFPGAQDLFGFGQPNTFDNVKAGTDIGGSVRGRLGVLLRPDLLAYGVGGLGIQRYGFTASCQGTVFNTSLCTGNHAVKNDAVKLGWTVGLGLEARLTENWFARAEYSYANFGSEHFHFAFPGDASMSGETATMDSKVDLTTQAVTVGIAYKFGGEPNDGVSIKDATPTYSGPGYADILTRPYIFYVGGAIGEYWINSEHTHHAIGLWNNFPADKAFVEQRGTGKINGSDPTISAFMGLEHRRNNILVGVEFDANYMGFQRRVEIAPGPTNFGGADFFTSVRIAHLETLRARIGYTVGSTTLFMTGGLAMGEVDFNQSINFPGSAASYADGRQLKFGWVVGGGFEQQLSRDVTLRAEYLYADLGRLTKNFTNNCPSGTTNPNCLVTYPAGFDHRVDYDVTAQIARVGLKVAMYEFGGGGGEPYKAGAVPGAYVDYSTMKTDFSGLYISPIAGTLSGQTTFAIGRWNDNFNYFPSPYGTGEIHKVKLDGFTFGGVLGYQKQFGNLVLGTDVSLQSGIVDGKSDCSPNAGGPITAECRSRLVYDVAWRVRAGYAMDKWMVYVNGGPAFAKIDNEVSYGGTSTGCCGTVNASFFNEHGSAFAKGWTYGAGIEYEWKPGVIVGMSYNHTQLEDVIVDLRRNDGSTNSRRLVGVDPDVIGSSLKIKLGDTAQAPIQAPPAPATQQVAAAAAPPPAPAPAAAPAPQRPRPAAARPSAPKPVAAPAAATPAAAQAPAVKVAPPAATKPAPKPEVPVDGTPAEPAPQMGKPQK